MREAETISPDYWTRVRKLGSDLGPISAENRRKSKAGDLAFFLHLVEGRFQFVQDYS
jgi:hypothetical protein